MGGARLRTNCIRGRQYVTQRGIHAQHVYRVPLRLCLLLAMRKLQRVPIVFIAKTFRILRIVVAQVNFWFLIFF